MAIRADQGSGRRELSFGCFELILSYPSSVASGTHEIPHHANDYGGGSASGIKGQRAKPSASSHRLIVATTSDRSVAGGRRRFAGTQLTRSLRLFSLGVSRPMQRTSSLH